jgi:uncharacterized protein YbjQ (UPF0145 family)
MSGAHFLLIGLFYLAIFVGRKFIVKGIFLLNPLRSIFGEQALSRKPGFKEKKFTASLNDRDLKKMPERMREGIIALDNNKLPPYVQERITAQREGNLPWTSAASVNDWLLLRSLDLQPLGLVRGCSYYQIGFSIEDHIARIDRSSSIGYLTGSRELPDYGGVIRKACHLALERLRDEAKLHGAHAVVDIKLIPKMPNKNDKIVEFEATGTAVQLKGQSNPPARPLLCTTSMSDFAKLLQAGSMPVGIAIGVGVYYAQTNLFSFDNPLNRLIRNQEITSYSDAIYHVRNIALRHMKEDVRHMGGSGVLGSFTDFSVEKFEHKQEDSHEKTIEHILKFICLGTVLDKLNHYVRPKVKSVMILNKKNNNVKLNREVNAYDE